MERVLNLMPLILLGLLLPGLAACGPEDGEDYDWSEPFDASQTGWLLSVHGVAGDDLYAVGGSPTEGVMLHYDGSEWAPVELGVDVPLLNWVYAFSADDIWSVGNGGTVIHWDGESWSKQQTPTEEDLWGIWGAAPDNLWAVGGRGREVGQATILRNQGQGWEAVTIPNLERPNVFAFFKVWGTGPNDVYIVGQRGIVLHWNGTELIETPVGSSEDLISVWGTGPDRIAIVGGRNNGVLTRWNGETWSTESLAPMPGLNGVWMRDENAVHVVGNNGTVSVVDFETLERTDGEVSTDLAVHAVFGDPSGGLTAVGGNLAFVQGPYEGLLIHRQLESSE